MHEWFHTMVHDPTLWIWLKETCLMAAVAVLICGGMCLLGVGQLYARSKYWLHYERRRNKRS